MIPVRLFPLLFFPLCLDPVAKADPPAVLSPDGRFRLEHFPSEEVAAGKRPAFGIIETATGKLVSDPREDLGDPDRPEETILWAPDSRAYALTTRVGTRHLDTFLYRWDGTSFVRAKWEGDGTIEGWADEAVEAAMRDLGFSDAAHRGRILAGDGLAERWLGPDRLILTDIQECLVTEGDREETVSGTARAIVRWDEAGACYRIESRQPVALPGATETDPTLFTPRPGRVVPERR